jgi:hypothetical protein
LRKGDNSIMEQPNSDNIVKTAVGVAGGSALLAPALPLALPALPLAMPVIHGLAGIALIGAGVFAVVQAAGAISSLDNPFQPKKL